MKPLAQVSVSQVTVGYPISQEHTRLFAGLTRRGANVKQASCAGQRTQRIPAQTDQ